MEPVAPLGEAPGRPAYIAAVERLESFVTGERPVPLAGVGDEILAVAALLERQPSLRRALSDPSRSGSDRAGLLDVIVDGKVAEDTAALLRTLVAGRWSRPTELLTNMERLGVEALLASADSAGELSDVEDELFRFGQFVDGNVELAAALGSSTTPPARRAELARSLLEGKVSAATLRLVDVALRGFGGRTFSASLARLVELAAERRERQIAYVTVASPLSAEQETRLAARLSQLYDREVEVKVSVDPEVLGGVSVRVNHDLYDGTVSRRIHAARSGLAK